MALTPIDVQQKTFGTALRGYDLDEVDDFLDEVVTSLKGYEQRLVEAQARIQALESELADKGDSESAISRALVAAQRSADMIIEDANREAARLLADARTQSEMMEAVRQEERAKLDLEISSMKAGVAEVRDKVRALATSLEGDVEEMERSVAAAEAQLTGDEPKASPDASPDAAAAATVAPGFAVAVEAIADDQADMGTQDEPSAASLHEVVDVESVTETALDLEPDDPDPWVDRAGEAVERGSDLDPWVTPLQDDVAASLPEPPPSVAQWGPSWSDDVESEAAAPHDPLEAALAEATFADLDGVDEVEDVEGNLVEEVAEEVEEDVAGEIATADALQTDDADAGEAWERAGLEGWGSDTTSAPDDDRPRRPWE
jgi:DivIVA domain-containing protein